MAQAARTLVAATLLPLALCAQVGRPDKATISYADAEPLLHTLAGHLPQELVGKSRKHIEEIWPGWVARHDAEIRRRVARGDEDSVVNLWLFGTSFTDLSPSRAADIATRGEAATPSQIVAARLEDLLRAMVSPGTNERVRFARRLLESHRIALDTAAGQEQGRALLHELARRMLAENTAYTRALGAAKTLEDPIARLTAHASLYRDRGLSSDTSILSSFAVRTALDALNTSGLLGDPPIRRVAIIGPGLDFLNKADGHDFYPEQTIQPFAVIDALLHLGIADPRNLEVTTFDVSARVNQHMTTARDRARAGGEYVVQLPLSGAERWTQELVAYWQEWGTRVGDPVRPSTAPRAAPALRVRAVRLRPEIVASVDPQDLNIVLERIEPLRDEDRFDLVVATNVFAYYGTFEQSLALVNIARMLRPGGSLLSNQAVVPIPPMKPAIGRTRVVYSNKQHDEIFWYERR
jgi:SAM-dependent methyltransferase